MAKKRIIILGAGLTGLSLAWHLKKKRIDALIFEKEPEIGGLCRSKKIGGFTFDYCGHLLHFRKPYALKLVNNLLNKKLIEHKRDAWIYSFKQYIPYPFQANFHYLPEAVRKECLAGFLKAQSRKGKRIVKNINFSDWIYGNFGQGIARYFMIPYNTKFWTVDPRELTSEWSGNFIPVPDIKQLTKGELDGNGAKYGYNHKFWYPNAGGINSLALSLAQGLKNIWTDCKAISIDLDKKTVRLSSGVKEKFDILISTIPMPELPNLINNLPKRIESCIGLLKWNSILNLNLGLKFGNASNKHWIYFPEKNADFFRVGFFNSFSPNMAPLNNSSLYTEISYSKKRQLSKKDYINKAITELRRLNILRKTCDIAAMDINNIEYAYPIYDFNRVNALKDINGFLNNKSIFSIGRYGGWKYLSMEGAILEGKEVAERIAFGCV